MKVVVAAVQDAQRKTNEHSYNTKAGATSPKKLKPSFLSSPTVYQTLHYGDPYIKSPKRRFFIDFFDFFGGPGPGVRGPFGRMGNVNWVILGFRSEKCTQFFLGPRTSDFRPDYRNSYIKGKTNQNNLRFVNIFSGICFGFFECFRAVSVVNAGFWRLKAPETSI